MMMAIKPKRSTNKRAKTYIYQCVCACSLCGFVSAWGFHRLDPIHIVKRKRRRGFLNSSLLCFAPTRIESLVFPDSLSPSSHSVMSRVRVCLDFPTLCAWPSPLLASIHISLSSLASYFYFFLHVLSFPIFFFFLTNTSGSSRK